MSLDPELEQKVREKVRNSCEWGYEGPLLEAIDELRATNARLRAALQMIADPIDSDILERARTDEDYGDAYFKMNKTRREWAKEALSSDASSDLVVIREAIKAFDSIERVEMQVVQATQVHQARATLRARFGDGK